MLQDLVVPESNRSSEDWLERAVADACRLVSTGDHATIRSVTVVGGRRLTGPELLRVRKYAAASGVRLVMDGDGTVTLRREPVSDPTLDSELDIDAVARPDAAQRRRGFRLTRRWWPLGGQFRILRLHH